MQTEGALFYANVKYNRDMAKYKGKPKGRIGEGWRQIMSPAELLQKVSELGVNINERTLRDYKNKYRCIPQPLTGRLGTGGSWSDYPDHAVAELFASWRIIKGKVGLKGKADIMSDVRLRALEAEQQDEVKPGSSMDLLGGDPINTLAWHWLLEKRKILCGFSPDDKVTMGIETIDDGRVVNVVTFYEFCPMSNGERSKEIIR